ncbi:MULTISPECIES: HAMP domain-containing methyl-accepting chemotaxis protein [Ensifer]|jgi:methyl-accepting chemotaxis protein|uniref:HAMP domain-containing methyl-accepting chemotaxis protein n=1 Tax=Ensifer TaxID=106591 RepID=UPI00046D3894|nr:MULTISPECIES: HAMP domain-containing methyl-accepting chemotaxis protein [Ensifer]KQU71942.1 chemotaxis protein [Ensifer sp. Root31]KQW44129.1 chemotaxis protein [Ensifer sp. Root1252]KQW84278.1 chemotaxis protein [Ensifer sp. Root127]KQY61206.1 chemotaxis protein [Ensifer sp. Root142]KRC57843.1 chemotaxis protein [Ensifer sp. Root231]
MSRLKISHTLIALFLMVGLIVTVLAVASLGGIKMMNERNNEIATTWLPRVSLSRALETQLSDTRMSFARHLISLTPFEKKAAEKVIGETVDGFNKLSDEYAALMVNDADKAALEKVKSAYEAYLSVSAGMVKLSNNLENMKAQSVFKVEMREREQQVDQAIKEMRALNLAGADAAVADSSTTHDQIRMIEMAVIAVAALIVLGAIFYAIRGIARPIQIITRSMAGLANGDTATAIPYGVRKDEIGEMARAVEVFREAAISNLQLEEDAKVQRSQAEAERHRVTEEAEAAAQLRLQEATAGLATGLRRLAAGDLAFQLNEPFAPDFEQLRHDLNQAVAQLADTLAAVSSSSGSIDSGAREVSQSADDLSRRTEQQAASLEETAAALDQITVNVGSSSKRTNEARAIASQANESAHKSGAIVSGAIDAMGRIEHSSSQISNIIGVIDEIAFQTNLLALNAGVEAARAGDAGKGFAVVAQEVRELAQRSANAAKEIKDLIRNSAVEVQSGVKLVRETGEALRTIEGFIVTINQHMDAIAVSAQEQSAGLSEVNTAVNQMDQVTQQNAAMVEEANAASATLAQEAGRLRELIARFTLAQDSGHGYAPWTGSSRRAA